jgi:hypothetical protein
MKSLCKCVCTLCKVHCICIALTNLGTKLVSRLLACRQSCHSALNPSRCHLRVHSHARYRKLHLHPIRHNNSAR